MIECIFTLDYELYGSGEGSLRALVYEPAERLYEIFKKRRSRFVAFVEAAELEKIEDQGADEASGAVARQLRKLHAEGFELGFHLHPQWYSGRFERGKWMLDYSEYNLCSLQKARIAHMIDRGLGYIQRLLGDAGFVPVAFRAGNWLFQPAKATAEILAARGIRVDSSVFKGGVQHRHNLDYRRALENGYLWEFAEDVNTPVASGLMLELPIYTRMVRPWRLCTAKRAGVQQKAPRSFSSCLHRFKDCLRLRQPQKFDFCRMTLPELTDMVDGEIKKDAISPGIYRPLVAIGHTKDLVDYDTVESFLAHLQEKGIATATFAQAYQTIGMADTPLLKRPEENNLLHNLPARGAAFL